MICTLVDSRRCLSFERRFEPVTFENITLPKGAGSTRIRKYLLTVCYRYAFTCFVKCMSDFCVACNRLVHLYSEYPLILEHPAEFFIQPHFAWHIIERHPKRVARSLPGSKIFKTPKLGTDTVNVQKFSWEKILCQWWDMTQCFKTLSQIQYHWATAVHRNWIIFKI